MFCVCEEVQGKEGIIKPVVDRLNVRCLCNIYKKSLADSWIKGSTAQKTLEL